LSSRKIHKFTSITSTHPKWTHKTSCDRCCISLVTLEDNKKRNISLPWKVKRAFPSTSAMEPWWYEERREMLVNHNRLYISSVHSHLYNKIIFLFACVFPPSKQSTGNKCAIRNEICSFIQICFIFHIPHYFHCRQDCHNKKNLFLYECAIMLAYICVHYHTCINDIIINENRNKYIVCSCENHPKICFFLRLLFLRLVFSLCLKLSVMEFMYDLRKYLWNSMKRKKCLQEEIVLNHLELLNVVQ